MADLKLNLRILLGKEIAFGPGKADLLDAIAEQGSISAAGAHLGMSYLRAWQLVDTMNRCFKQPLVETATGGTRGGGAKLTDYGIDILQRYRAMHSAAAKAAQKNFPGFDALLAATPRKPAVAKARRKPAKRRVS